MGIDQAAVYGRHTGASIAVDPNGDVLAESAAILDWIDEQVGPERALLPARGTDRRWALQLMATATGAADKGVAQLYEGAFRPPEKRAPRPRWSVRPTGSSSPRPSSRA
mgnify:CR=1 FL=1